MFSGFDIAVFLLVLGVLIFVHELGHFLAAKACNIYVDRFSLGMPPRLIGFKYGETDYCIGLLPIGGFVKMAGQEDAPLSDEERTQTYGHVPSERWFNNKPIWQRAFVLAAGPFMNVVLAVLIYGGLAAAGREVPLATLDTRVGLVEEASPASKAPLFALAADRDVDPAQEPDETGWKTGDRIVSINGKPMERFQDIFFEAVLGKGKVARVEFERAGPDGSSARYVSFIEPKILDEEIKATRYGFAPFSAALIDYVMPSSPAEAFGLQAGDIIERANGERVDSNTFSKLVRELEPGLEVQLDVRRGDQALILTMQTRSEGRIDGFGFAPPLRPFLLLGEDAKPKVATEDAELLSRTELRTGDAVATVNGDANVGAALRALYESHQEGPFEIGLERDGDAHTLSLTMTDLLHALTGLDPSGPVEVAGVTDAMTESTKVKRRDTIVEIEGQPATARVLRKFEQQKAGESVQVTVERPALLLGLAQSEERFDAELPVAKVQQIGVVWGTETTVLRSTPAEVIPVALSECWRTTVQTYATLQRLVTGALSPELLGGPVMIAEVTTRAARIGLQPLFEMMALISVNLAIFNLLPLPVLDGGQLTFLAIEAVRRKPVSMRVMEAVQQVGVLLILGLIVFVTFNDISRVVERWLP